MNSEYKRVQMMEEAGITSDDLHEYIKFITKDDPDPDYDGTRKVINQITAWKKKTGRK